MVAGGARGTACVRGGHCKNVRCRCHRRGSGPCRPRSSQLEHGQHHSRQRRRLHLLRTCRTISGPHQRSFEVLVQAGKAHGAFDYLAAKAAQEKLRLEFAESISKFDAVLTLPAFGEAPEGLSCTGDAEYCAPWTLLGVPALSLPAGVGTTGPP